MNSFKYKFRPRYDEVDQMGYMYHAHYVTYCHLARTELMRSIGLHDAFIESQGIMMPITDVQLKYKKAAHYDEPVSIETSIPKMPRVKCDFEFTFKNEQGEILCFATTSIAFVDKNSRKAMRVPKFILEKLNT